MNLLKFFKTTPKTTASKNMPSPKEVEAILEENLLLRHQNAILQKAIAGEVDDLVASEVERSLFERELVRIQTRQSPRYSPLSGYDNDMW
jgi:hypothetical protein